MKQFLGKIETEEAERWMRAAAEQAKKATCLRAKCGTVIVAEGGIIGSGFNSPPLDDERNRTCQYEYGESPKPKYDRSCCIHAEWRAIMDALKRNPDNIAGSRLYFVRVDGDGKILKSGKPFCTVCSRLALDAGINEFLLWHTDGICAYPTGEYNALSYAFHNPQPVSRTLT